MDYGILLNDGIQISNKIGLKMKVDSMS